MSKNYNGLNNNQIEAMKIKYGENVILEKEPPTMFERIKDKFSDSLIIILTVFSFILAIKSIFIDKEFPYDFCGMISVLILNAGMSIKSDIDSEKQYKNLKDSIDIPLVTVIRNDKIVQIKSTELVVGDLMLIENGEKAYADGIIVESDNLKVSNADINGESEEVKLNVIDDYKINYDNIDSEINNSNFIHSGAVITEGKAKAVVVRVGINTESGKALNNIEEVEETPLDVKLNNMVKGMTTISYIGAGIVFLVDMFSYVIRSGSFIQYLNKGFMNIGLDILVALMLALSIVACIVPEGLPLLKTIVLSKNSKKMKEHNVLVKNVNKGETSGSISHLFSDKTGTITKGVLEVVETFGGDLTNIDLNLNNKITNITLKCISNNTASVYDSSDNIIGGNFTDKAFLKWIGKDNYNNNKENIVKEQLFNSSNKYSSSELDGELKTIYKGASEKLLQYATKCIDSNGNEIEFDKDKVLNKINELANRSMRTLAYGYSRKELVENEINDDFVLVGIVGIRDEIRESSKKAIKQLQNASVKFTMITGDKKETAVAIAKECGLIKDKNDLVFTNDELLNMSDEEIKQVLPNIKVVARAMPNMKRKLAKLSQDIGEVVGMTGDGVNDAPALKQADIGFAMGSGTDVAKESGDIIILDNNLESIAYALSSGRTIYKNIQKFLKYQLAISIGIGAINILTPLFGITQTLSVMSILWINAIMDTLASLALCGEPTEDSYMKEKPINRNANIISKEMLKTLLVSGCYFTIVGMSYLFLPIFKQIFNETHMTGYFALFVFISVFNGFNVRTNSINVFKRIKENFDFIKIMALISILQVLVVNFGGKLFGCIPMNLKQWIIILGLSILIIPIDLIKKKLLHK